MRIRPILAALPLLLSLHAVAAPPPGGGGATASAACVTVADGWIRMPPAPRPMLAGFGRITNACSEAQAVVAVRSPRFGEVSLHETRVVDGVSRMRGIERLPLAPGAEAVLQPGGLHLMLMQPDRALAEGEQVPLVLVLADGREVAAALTVRKTPPR